MSMVGIRVQNLSKLYRIGLNDKVHDTLGGAIASWLIAPISNFRRLRNLSRFNGNGDAPDVIWALKDVSFEVKQGEVVGIIGRNGAGKSTLLKIISRITEPTSGRVEIRGRISSLLEVGTGFHPELTGRENVYLNGSILGMTRGEIEHKFDEIVDFSGVEKFIDTPVKHYSSGMRVRLAFSVAAHLEPEILLVDEVLAVGDAVFQKKCLGKMGEVAEHGRTVLFVSHNMGAITNLCPHSIYLENGRIAEMGPTGDVVASYVARTSADIPDEGIADLRSRRRADSLDDRCAQFQWVRTLNADHQQTGTFLEGEPIIIEVGLVVNRPVRNLQVGCTVFHLNPSVELFTVPSAEDHDELAQGTYSLRLRIDPNYLREGSYKPVLKMFANGIRQDTLPETIRFSVVRYNAPGGNAAHFAGWVAGPLRLPYEWEEMQPVSDVVLSDAPAGAPLGGRP